MSASLQRILIADDDLDFAESVGELMTLRGFDCRIVNHAEEVIAAGETDWRAVVARLTGPVPGGQPVFFHKHMTHHLLDEVDRGWLAEVVNCFLIRDPREVIASYARVRDSVTVEDVGVPQQAAIYDAVRGLTGAPPPVLDAADVLRDYVAHDDLFVATEAAAGLAASGGKDAAELLATRVPQSIAGNRELAAVAGMLDS